MRFAWMGVALALGLRLAWWLRGRGGSWTAAVLAAWAGIVSAVELGVADRVTFVHGDADTVYSDSGPHHRWSAGGLFDNIRVNGNELNFRNRGNSGTGHGWAGAYMAAWNCAAAARRKGASCRWKKLYPWCGLNCACRASLGHPICGGS